jgi:Fic family protein
MDNSPQTRDSSDRAGVYRRQPGGFKAFVPQPLPPDPPVQLEGALQKSLSDADRALGRLDGSIQTLPDPDLFVFMYVRKEAVLSSQIEGTQSSIQDVIAAEAKIMNASRRSDAYEVINYITAMNYGIERLATLPVSGRLFCEIHERLVRNVRGSNLTPGEIRTSQNWIAGSLPSNAVFVPPPPEEVPQALSDLEKFLHMDSQLPLLVKIGLAHAQFETIHPFLDGNGRVGRLLITFLLCEREALTKPVLYLSYYFKQHRAEYYERLQAVRDAGKWEEWLTFFLTGVKVVSNQAVETARQILNLRENDRSLIVNKLGRAAGNGHKVLEHLYQNPVVSVNEVERITGTTYAAANQLVANLTDQGILEELTGLKRNRRFGYQKYVDLFSESIDPTTDGEDE